MAVKETRETGREAELERLLRGVCHAMADATRRHTLALGVSPAAIRCLAVCAERGDLTVSEVGERSGVTAGTVSRVVDGLESRGLVRRHRSPEDRRVITVQPTEAGRALLQEVVGYRREVLVHAMARISGEDLEACGRVLARLRANLAPFGDGR